MKTAGAAPDLYALLCAKARDAGAVRRVLLGLNWSVAEIDGAAGLCFSPVEAPRTLPWSGTLAGRSAGELCDWVRSWNPCEAAVGAAVINAAVNAAAPARFAALPLEENGPPHLRVFGHFAPQLRGARVAVIGHYPALREFLWREQGASIDYQCIERRPQPGDLPDTAAEQVLPGADWVFITASSIANKTLPRLLQLSRSATVVLMGPSLPWLTEWAQFGVDYLAGVAVRDRELLFRVAAEGGGTRIFDAAVEYRLLKL